jgi:hypothetical protein
LMKDIYVRGGILFEKRSHCDFPIKVSSADFILDSNSALSSFVNHSQNTGNMRTQKPCL